jgi:alpha-L-rhamnosidase
MNSFAHYAFGSVYVWMVENIGGIQRGSPSYREIVIAPQPGGSVNAARTRYDSIRGPIETDWKVTDGQMNLTVQTPANTKTLVRLPTIDPGAVRVDGQPLASLGIDPRAMSRAVEFDIPSGHYVFDFPVLASPSSSNPGRPE